MNIALRRLFSLLLVLLAVAPAFGQEAVTFKRVKFQSLAWVTNWKDLTNYREPLLQDPVKVEALAKDIWNCYSRVAPKDIVEQTTTLTLTAGEKFRGRMQKDPKSGEAGLAINIGSFYSPTAKRLVPRSMFAAVVAHEATHAWAYDQYFKYGKESIFQKYFDVFWVGQGVEINDVDDDIGMVIRYLRDKSAFASEYSAKGPHEDLAEITKFYLLGKPIPEEKWKFLVKDTGYVKFIAHARAGYQDFLKAYPNHPQ